MDILSFWANLEPMGREVSSRYQNLIIIFRNNLNKSQVQGRTLQVARKPLEEGSTLFFHPPNTLSYST
jgi:hypothetical protein